MPVPAAVGARPSPSLRRTHHVQHLRFHPDPRRPRSGVAAHRRLRLRARLAPLHPQQRRDDGGRVRTLTTKDGGVLLERLQAFDESRRTLTYSVDESPFPLTSYVSTLRVTEIPGRPDVALVEWSGAFQPDGVSEDKAVSLFQGIYTDGLKAVQQAFGG